MTTKCVLGYMQVIERCTQIPSTPVTRIIIAKNVHILSSSSSTHFMELNENNCHYLKVITCQYIYILILLDGKVQYPCVRTPYIKKEMTSHNKEYKNIKSGFFHYFNDIFVSMLKSI